ncbi:MAG: secondary thiamine-phosphate synthase enzyme YjbQ [Actinomycetota bacterium]|nr:secondary thiamine-phosphate synthase enzyme YjbQ [Actinomycetota bacterium]
MRSYTDYLTFETKKRRDYVNITGRVSDAVAASGIAEGLCHVSAMHITAGVYVNDDESGFRADLTALLERLAPEGADYRHHQTGEDNGEAHLRNMMVGHQVVLPVTEGALDLGPWEQVFYAEFDGQRRKRVVIKIIGE